MYLPRYICIYLGSLWIDKREGRLVGKRVMCGCQKLCLVIADRIFFSLHKHILM